jgi:hypothetical protein
VVSLESLQSKVDEASPGQVVELPRGDFAPLQITKAIALKGNQTCFWFDGASPAIDVTAPGVLLQDLVLQPVEIEMSDCLALRVASHVRLNARHLMVRGRVEGLGSHSDGWLLPKALNLGYICQRVSFFEFDVGVPRACTLSTDIDGVQLQRRALSPGIHSIRFRLGDAMRDTLVIGKLSVETPEIVRVIPIYGEVGKLDRGVALQRISLFHIAEDDRGAFTPTDMGLHNVESLTGPQFGLASPIDPRDLLSSRQHAERIASRKID